MVLNKNKINIYYLILIFNKMHYKISEVDKTRCNGCEKCVQVCHANCFEMINEDDKIVANFYNANNCDSCGDCIVICPIEKSAIILSDKDNVGGHVTSIDKDKCAACGKCIDTCPDKNIEIVEENGQIFAKIKDPKKCIADGHCSFCCQVDDKVYSTL